MTKRTALLVVSAACGAVGYNATALLLLIAWVVWCAFASWRAL